jgi:hypothetical protein
MKIDSLDRMWRDCTKSFDDEDAQIWNVGLEEEGGKQVEGIA